METARIETWRDACVHVATTCAVRAAGDTQAEVTVTLSDDRSSTLQMRAFELDGATWLEVSGAIGKLASTSPVGLLQSNTILAVGGLAVARSGELVIRQVLPLAGLRRIDLDETLLTLAEQQVVAHGALQADIDAKR